MKEESKARRQRKRRPKAMNLRTLSRVLTTAITRLEDDLLETSEPEEVRKIAHALATLAGCYGRLAETADLEARIAAIEAMQEAQQSYGRAA
jgi:hypothetical protein